MVAAWSATRTVTSMRANSKTINPTEKVFTLGSMVRSTRENGSKDSKKAKVFGKEFSETRISVSGRKARQMDTACISGKMETGTKASGSFVLNMDKEPTFLQTAMFIQVNIRMANHMDSDNTNGKTQVSTLENSSKV